jgi:hypothetical protein
MRDRNIIYTRGRISFIFLRSSFQTEDVRQLGGGGGTTALCLEGRGGGVVGGEATAEGKFSFELPYSLIFRNRIQIFH